MAEYYALLARAVGALQRNDESSRREIYVKARSALIRQLKAITPPLPPSEISKQRLALEEAIRRVEREAAEAAAAAMLSEEEIARRAEQALEEALSSDAPLEEPVEDLAEAPPPRPSPPPRTESATFQPGGRVQPEVMSPDAAAEETSQEAYAEVVQPQPANRAGPRAPTWERAATVTDVEEAPPPPQPRPARERARDPRRGGRGWERAPRRSRRKRSVAARLTILVLALIVVGAGGYFGYQYRDDISDFVTSLVGAGTNNASDTTDVASADTGTEQTGDAVTSADAASAPADDTAAVDEEPVILPDAVAYLYEEPPPSSPSAPKFDASITWSLVDDPEAGDVIAANITIPEEGLQIALRIAQSSDPQYSHEISVLVTQDAAHADDPLASVENLAVKTSEESIGAELQGTALNDPDFYLLALPENDAILNNNRLNLSPWFDLNLVFDSGRRAIVTFSKGRQGTDVFEQAFAAWQG